MSDLVAELKGALAINNVERIDQLRDIGLTQLAKFPASVSKEALDLVTRACVNRGDERALAQIAQQLPDKEATPGNANLSLREMAHLQMVRGYVYRQRKEADNAQRCFRSALDLASYFGDSDMQELAKSLIGNLDIYRG